MKKSNNFVIGTYMKNTMISNWSLIIWKKKTVNKRSTGLKLARPSDCYDKFVIKIVFQIWYQVPILIWYFGPFFYRKNKNINLLQKKLTNYTKRKKVLLHYLRNHNSSVPTTKKNHDSYISHTVLVLINLLFRV